MEPVSIGVLGCGTISDAYLGGTDQFDSYEVVACADIDTERTEAKADEYGIRGTDPKTMLADDEIEIIVNLTPPSVHAKTCSQILSAGKHVYVEKPLATGSAEAAKIRSMAVDAGLLVGSAPDTFLGAGLQTCRTIIDDGRIGELIGATAIWGSGGHESWHPNPDLYYDEGGGPLFDMGPYYVTGLVTLLGPARRVMGAVSRASDERTIPSEPRHGETIDVQVPTHEAGVIEFAGGAIANVMTSFDTPGGSTFTSPAFEIYGSEGSLSLPDPNRFDGPVLLQKPGEEPEQVELTHSYTGGRGAGVADLAAAIKGDWSHRTSGELAHHVLEILEGVRDSSDTDRHVFPESCIEQPEPLPESFPDEL